MVGSYLYFGNLEDLKDIVKEAGFDIFDIEKFELKKNMTKLDS